MKQIKTAFQKVLSVLLLMTCAEFAGAVDLLEIYRRALDSDPQYRQVAATKRAILEQRPQALAQLLPSLSFNANAFTNEQEIDSIFNPIGQQGKVSFGSHGYSLDLVQPLFRGRSDYPLPASRQPDTTGRCGIDCSRTGPDITRRRGLF